MAKETNYDEIFHAQAHFRLLLDSMARPGKLNKLEEPAVNPPAGIHKATALVAFALLNRDVCFYAGGRPEIEEYIKTNTFSSAAAADEADFVFISGAGTAQGLKMAKTGELEYPEKSATAVIDIEQIFDRPTDDTTELILAGPGVNGEKRIYVRGLSQEVLLTIKEHNCEYPLGIDVVLVDKQGQLACLPRSNKFLWN
jgi:alpha-D-ribose 1-methylphosphonate 5-triphosphate synthase subunit PhnH